MATLLRTPTFQAHPPPRLSTPVSAKFSCVSFKLSSTKFHHLSSSLRSVNFVPFASDGETETTQVQVDQQPQPQFKDSPNGVIDIEDNTTDEDADADETPISPLLTLLQSYKEALINNDEYRVAEAESLFKAFEGEKIGLEGKVNSLSEELSVEKERILRISADFDNFRKRTERERLSLVTNAQGEVVESLLPVLDNFERAKTQIKVETEGEEKIRNSYQGIYKQFIEILGSLGVEPVQTTGNPFDPLLHEAIMREESTEFDEGIIIEDFRKGFKLGDRLLRPSMVKVSAGPGLGKPEQVARQERNTSEALRPSLLEDQETST